MKSKGKDLEISNKSNINSNNKDKVSINTSQGLDKDKESMQGDKKSETKSSQNETTKLWPVFGRITTDVEGRKQESFWLKDKKVIDNDYQVSIEGKLNRVGKKKKQVKQYHYYLQGCYLCYKDKVTDKVLKGYIKLGPNIKAEKKHFPGKKEDIHFIEFSKNGNIRKIYSKDQVIINDWFKQVRRYCVLSKFEQNYEQLEQLGKGAFSTVFKVKRKEDGFIYAAKIYYKTKLEESKHGDKFVQMMINEYETLQKMQHPNILTLHEVYQENYMVIYVIDFIQGGEIYAILKKYKQMDEQKCVGIIKQITDGLLALHKESIVHRDLKLENVMYMDKTETDIKLIDFGFSEKINKVKLVSRAGTPGFLPPELFKLHPYTDKGDIFSLGVILYCLIVGSTPFKAENYKAVIENNKNCRVNYDVEALKNVSEECLDCLKGMLAQDPDKRLSAKEILETKWIQKYFPTEDEEEDNYTYSKSYRQKSSFFIRSYSESSDQSRRDSSLGLSAFQSQVGGDNPRSLYRKSQKSLSQYSQRGSKRGSIASHGTFKTISENSDDEPINEETNYQDFQSIRSSMSGKDSEVQKEGKSSQSLNAKFQKLNHVDPKFIYYIKSNIYEQN